MRATIAIIALFGAGAFAHPSFKHRHHNKRDTVQTIRQGDDIIIEHIVDVYVTLTPGQTVPTAAPDPQDPLSQAPFTSLSGAASTPSLSAANSSVHASDTSSALSSGVPTSATSAVVAQEKYAPPGNGNGWGPPNGQWPSSWAWGANPGPSQPPSQPSDLPQGPSSLLPSSQAPLSSVPMQSPIIPSAPIPSSQVPISSIPAKSPVVPSSAVPVSSAAPQAGSSSGTFWAQSPLSPLSGGKDVLTSANTWRKTWLNLPPFTWSSTLANNSYMTATQPTYYTTDPTTGQQVPHNEGGAMVMGHDLYPGSNAQCIATGNDATGNGNLSPFEVAWLMWICEEPNSAIQSACNQIGSKPTTETGHADIIKGTVSQIGCYYMNSVGNSGYTGMWTCDFAE